MLLYINAYLEIYFTMVIIIKNHSIPHQFWYKNLSFVSLGTKLMGRTPPYLNWSKPKLSSPEKQLARHKARHILYNTLQISCQSNGAIDYPAHWALRKAIIELEDG